MQGDTGQITVGSDHIAAMRAHLGDGIIERAFQAGGIPQVDLLLLRGLDSQLLL